MKKKLAYVLSFMLLFSSLTPIAYAEDADSQQTETTAETPSTKAAEDEKATEKAADAEKADEKPAAKPATKPAASSTVTSDTYLADQLSDLKSLSKDNKKKINVMLKMGAVESETADKFGADTAITYAQLAKAAVLAAGLTIDPNKVKQSDPAFAYIEALKAVSSKTNDGDNMYDPKGVVTRQELAMLLIKALGLDDKAKAAAPSKDETVDDKYKSYVAYALQQKLMANVTGGKFEGKTNVSKQTLALTAHEAWRLHTSTAKPAKASIAEVKVIGNSKLVVRLNRDVDTDSAVLTLTKDGLLDSENNPLPLNGGIDWSEDNTTATMSLDDKLTFGSYQIALSDVDVENGTMTFMPETERVTKIEFVTDTEKLPKSKVLIEYKATNQFGEKMELSSSNMNIYVGASNKIVPGVFSRTHSIGLDLSDVLYNSSITVVIFEKSGYVSASKTFPVGDPPQVKKVDLGDPQNNLKLPSGQLLFKAGEKAYLTFKAYDQYENRIVDTKYLNTGIQRSFTGAMGNVFRNEGQNDFIDYENDGYPELQLVPYPNLDSDKEVTLTLFYDGQQTSQTVTVKSPKTPSEITIGPLKQKFTEGDTNVSVNLKIVDSSNYELNELERESLLTTGKITVFATGGLVLATPAIDSKGAIIVQQVTGPGPSTINIRVNGTGQMVTLQTDVGAGRRPDKITVDTANSASNLLALNGLSTKFASTGKTAAKAQFIIYDQFGVEYKINRDDYKVQFKLERISGDSGSVTDVTYRNARNTQFTLPFSDVSPTVLKEVGDVSSLGYTVNPSPTLTGSYKLIASIIHLDSYGQILETLSSDSITVDIKNIMNANLNYSVEMSKSGDLLAVKRVLFDSGAATSVTDVTYLMKDYSMFTQTASIKVRDGSSIDAFTITAKAVTSSNPKVIAAIGNRVIGLDSGKADLTVWYESPLGGVQKLTISKGSNVDEIVPTEIKTNGDATITGDHAAKLDGKFIWDSSLMGKLQATTDYDTVNLHQATSLLGVAGVQAFISDIVYTTDVAKDQDEVKVNADYTLTYTKKGAATTISKFTIYVVVGTYSKPFVVNLN